MAAQEMSDYINGQFVSDQSSRQKNEDDELPSERRHCRLMFLSFGLLCILQAILNVSLRLTFYSGEESSGLDSNTTELTGCEQLKTSYNKTTAQCNVLQDSFQALIKEKDQFENLTNKLSTDKTKVEEENKRLQRRVMELVSKTLDIQTYIKNVTEERDMLKRMQNNIVQHSQQGWLYFSHSFYFVSSTKKKRQDCRDDCLRRDADLVIVNSREEQEFITQFKKKIWIGLTDIETEWKWKWVDGTPLTTSYWCRGEPNNDLGRDEDCVEIRPDDTVNTWNDETCKIENFWICEKPAAPYIQRP